MSLSLSRALRISASPCIALIGAGGKTTAMFQLARELPSPVFVTATTHLGAWQIGLADQHIITEIPEPIEKMEDGLSGIILITGRIDQDRTTPVSDTLLNWLHQFCRVHSIPLLIEADGAHEKPLKAWAGHEPPIPEFTEQVVQVAGLSGLYQPLNEGLVHRAEIFSALGGIAIGETISPQALTRVLTHAEGGLKNIPQGARKTMLLNQADTHPLLSAAWGMSHALLSKFDSVLVSNLKQKRLFAAHEPIAGIVLAAGESSRFGQPKQLLDWKGEPFVRAVARIALEAGLSPVVVVTGSSSEQVKEVVNDLTVLTIRNDDWKSGQGGSIRKGISALTSAPLHPGRNSGGAIFLLADQPQVSTSILHALIERHAQELSPIIAPMVLDQRANPVLFDRDTFSDLMTLEGDIGGRAVFHKHKVDYLPWHDDRLLLDIDTPEQYQRLVSNKDL